MKNKEKLPGTGTQTFYIELDKEWQKGNTYYTMGCDPYSTEPKNFYHKIRKFLGLKYEEVFTNSVVFKIHKDGKRELIK